MTTPDDNDDGYDPHLYRETEAPISNFETMIHLFKCSLGTGILAMPEAFKHSGMLVGIVSTILLGIFCMYSVFLLIRGQYILCKKLKVPLLTYPETMRLGCQQGPSCLQCLAPVASGITNFFLISFQIGMCCCYIVFVGSNVKFVLEQYISVKYSLEAYMLFLLPLFALIMCIRNLKLLAPFSLLANVITLITYSVAGWYITRGLPSFSDVPAVGQIENYPLYFGTTLYSVHTIGVIVAVENNMKDPKKFLGLCGLLNIALSIITLIYVMVGAFGYWRYGENINSSVTLNFPPKELLTQIINILYSIVIYLSYGLQGYVGFYILWTEYFEIHLKQNKQKIVWEFSLRMLIVAISFYAAVSVPLLGLFISFVGSFCISSLGIIFPAFVDLCAFWPHKLGPCKYVLIRDVLMILIGFFSLFSGCFSCIKEIIKELSDNDTNI